MGLFRDRHPPQTAFRVIAGLVLGLACLSAGCYVSVGDGSVNVGAAPSIVTDPQSVAVREGERATFSVGVVSIGDVRYQWRRNSQDIAGANADTYTTPPTSIFDDGALFSVRVSNGIGSTVSSSAALSVTPR